MRATKFQLRTEIKELRHVAGLMSNLCFNLSQRSMPIDQNTRDSMKSLQIAYDKIERREK